MGHLDCSFCYWRFWSLVIEFSFSSLCFCFFVVNRWESCSFGIPFYGLEFVIRSEKTKIGSALSGALVSTLIGLAASNLGIISSEAPAYDVVMKFLLPLAVPLLLFRADLRRVIKSTGTLLLAFLLGSGKLKLNISLTKYANL